MLGILYRHGYLDFDYGQVLAEARKVIQFRCLRDDAELSSLLEIGDKTQIATVPLAAKYATLLPVIAGMTSGMMLADVPAVLLGGIAATKLPLRLVHGIATAIFIGMGPFVLLGHGLKMGPV